MADNNTKDNLQHTRVFDQVVKEVGSIGALVFGVVWRHCQMRAGVCYASKETLGVLTGISRSTAIRHLKELVERGLVIDTTPSEKWRPHAYKVSDKALQLLEEGVSNWSVGVSERPVGVSQRHARCVNLTHEETIRKQRGNNKEGENATSTTPLLEVVMQYYDLRCQLMQYYLENMDELTNVSDVDSAIGVMLEDCAARLSQGEELTDAVLFDDATFGDALLAAGMLGVDNSYLSELFRRPVVVVDQSDQACHET